MIRKRIGGRAVFLLAFMMTNVVLSSPEEIPRISADTMLRLNSVVGVWRSPSPKWSPDGTQIIFSSILNDGGAVCISPEGGFPIRIPLADQGAGLIEYRGPVRYFDPRYSPDGKWIAYVSGRSGQPEIWLWSVSSGYDIQLTDLRGRIGGWSWSPDSRWIAFSLDKETHSYDIWKVSVPGKEVVRLSSDKRHEVNPVWGPDGQRIFYVRMDDSQVNHEIIETTATGQNARLIVSETDFFDSSSGNEFGPPLVSRDGKNVLFRSGRSGWINYWMVPVSGGDPKPMASEKADQNHARWSPDGQLIVYTSNHDGTHGLRVVSAEGGEPRSLMAPEMGVCGDPEWSPDGKQISFTFTSFDKIKDLYVVSIEGGQIKQLTFSMPPGDLMKRFVMPQKIAFPSSDGLIIHAYLYRPSDIGPGEKFPGIVWIHGGPTGQFEEMFQQQNSTSQPDVQFFVQHGYVILQPNIRGSSGYGKSFEKANDRCWGKCDLEDVLAGANYLRSLPFVDGEKTAITGQSYGGMMTMAAVVNAPDAFQAAIAEGGVIDWTRGSKDFDYELGSLPEFYELRRSLSPINHVEKIKTPIFVICGDGRGKIAADFQAFKEQLEKGKKTFLFKAYPNDTHYVHGWENRRQMFYDKLDFFDKYLKGKKVS